VIVFSKNDFVNTLLCQQVDFIRIFSYSYLSSPYVVTNHKQTRSKFRALIGWHCTKSSDKMC